MRVTLRGRLHELYAAIATGNIVRVRELRKREPDHARAAKDPDRDATPLEYATVYARKQIIRVLVAHGADARNGLGTALKGTGDGFEEFPELPSRGEYGAVAPLLGELLAPPSSSVDPGTHR